MLISFIILVDFGYPSVVLWFLTYTFFFIIWLQIFSLGTYLVKVIPETRPKLDIYVFIRPALVKHLSVGIHIYYLCKNDLVNRYGIYMSQMTTDMFH